MLSKITLLTSILFAITYPLCFWVSYKDPLKQNFHRFHIGLPCFVAGIIAVMVVLSPASGLMKNMIVSWVVILFAATFVSWKKETPNPIIITVPCIWGLVTLAAVFEEIVGRGTNPLGLLISIISGCILSAALYAMNLGHWYLNVHGLPLKHLRAASYVFGSFLILRLLIDVYALFVFKVMYDGEFLPLWQFAMTMDGIFIWLAVFFGVLFPLGSLYFVEGVLKVKNTNSATGILYVILSGVLIGDLAYKYYLIKFGIAL